jgi:uncharacterized protein YdhG (YjbR/CyaY superfamily)
MAPPATAQGVHHSPWHADAVTSNTVGLEVDMTVAHVDEYLAALPPTPRARLVALREAILALVPGATEAITYQMPTVKVKGRSLVAYAAFANHYSLFPMSKGIIEALGEAAAPYVAGKGTLRFGLDQPVPAEIIRGVVEGRLVELDAARRNRSNLRTGS